jgi:hypothetical protein
MHSSSIKKKDSWKTGYLKSMSRKIISSPLWEKELKDKDSPANQCNGFIFWNLVSLEYFPSEFDLTRFPVFPLSKQFELKYESSESSDYISSSLSQVSWSLESCSRRNEKLIKELMESLEKKKKPGNIKLEEIQKNNEKVKNSSLKLDTSTSSATENLCQICKSSDDHLLTCSKCSLSVHAKCYRPAPSSSFLCDQCENPDSIKTCVLCSKSEGIFRKTSHSACDSRFQVLNHVKNSETCLWVHCFCALHTPGVCFRNGSVELYALDLCKSGFQCEVCFSKVGMCIQCSFPQCYKFFHPECGKDQFVSSKSNEKKVFCDLHKSQKLRKILEFRQKQISEDLLKFCKSMEKFFNKCKAQARLVKKKRTGKTRGVSFKVFSSEEDLLLEYRIQQFLYKLNRSQKVPFQITINLKGNTRCSKVSISRPEYFSIIAPSVLLEESISIDRRSSEECFKRYQDTLFNKIRNEMMLLGKQISLYSGAGLPQVKQPRPKKKKVLQVSSDTYCVCNKPFYYEIPWMAEWTQAQWEEKVKENEMIECTKCENWFHLKCIGYSGSLERAREDNEWKCQKCESRENSRRTKS